MLYSRTLFIHSLCNTSQLLIPQNSNPLLPNPPPPWQPKICSLHLWVCFCFIDTFIYAVSYISHISDIRRYLSFFFWLTSLNLRITRSIHVAANGTISSFSIAESYSTGYISHIFLIHSSVDGHLIFPISWLFWIVPDNTLSHSILSQICKVAIIRSWILHVLYDLIIATNCEVGIIHLQLRDEQTETEIFTCKSHRINSAILSKKRQRNQRSNCQHSLDCGESKVIPEKPLLLLHWLCWSLWLCGSRLTVDNF